MVEFQKDTSRFGLAIEWDKALDIVRTAVKNGTFTLPDKQDYSDSKWKIACFVSALFTGLMDVEDLENAEFYQTSAWVKKCQISEQLYRNWQSDVFMDAVYEK